MCDVSPEVSKGQQYSATGVRGGSLAWWVCRFQRWLESAVSDSSPGGWLADVQENVRPGVYYVCFRS